MLELHTPLNSNEIEELNVGDMIYISGDIFCGRDAVLPKLVEMYENNTLNSLDCNLEGSVVFHTAVSPAGVGPTSSNKLEIEASIAPLSKAGVKLHLGKGKISPETIKALEENNSVFAVIPPVTALLREKTFKQEIVAFPELGMEAFHRLTIDKYPIIIAAAKGRSIYG